MLFYLFIKCWLLIDTTMLSLSDGFMSGTDVTNYLTKYRPPRKSYKNLYKPIFQNGNLYFPKKPKLTYKNLYFLQHIFNFLIKSSWL